MASDKSDSEMAVAEQWKIVLMYGRDLSRPRQITDT